VKVDAVAVIRDRLGLDVRTDLEAAPYWTTVFPLAEAAPRAFRVFHLQHAFRHHRLAGVGVRPGQDDGAPADLLQGETGEQPCRRVGQSPLECNGKVAPPPAAGVTGLTVTFPGPTVERASNAA